MNESRLTKINPRLFVIGGVALCLLLFVLHVLLYHNFFIDDAYITFRYVRQFTAGNGIVHNIGERVEGYSNFIWLMLLAPFHRLGFEIVNTSKILSVLLALATLVVTWRFGKRFTNPLIAPLLLVCSGPFIIWTMGGLETHLFTFLLVLAAYLFVRENDNQHGVWSAIWFGLLALTRPEGILFTGIAVLFRGWQLWQNKERPSRQDWVRAGILATIFGSYLLWRYNYYGNFLPNTIYAKSMGFHPRGFIEGAFYVYQIVLQLGGVFFIIFPSPLLCSMMNETRPYPTCFSTSASTLFSCSSAAAIGCLYCGFPCIFCP